ncbi:hypothetical protein EJ08DRAFT_679172 [Tothia fuscella]|uniref:Uncharacterized protein n=1 Tax=Tothia fuscella TaxID=1048955 RepID=A0A9P4TYJ2_9PEZI|nr:hypothetical protein EJ08DRAFT_679172 [Tothia fuscella]
MQALGTSKPISRTPPVHDSPGEHNAHIKEVPSNGALSSIRPISQSYNSLRDSSSVNARDFTYALGALLVEDEVSSESYMLAIQRYASDKHFAFMVEDCGAFVPPHNLSDIYDAVHDYPPVAVPSPDASVNEVKQFIYRILTWRNCWINHTVVPLAEAHPAVVQQVVNGWYSDGKALLEGPPELAHIIRETLAKLGGPDYGKMQRIDSVVVRPGSNGIIEGKASTDEKILRSMEPILQEACALPLPAPSPDEQEKEKKKKRFEV